ncbi:predicted protein [Naegleria gruberi]|uniref:Predicted protein n=1 Tax=Naegleria gruberi TaxID=5762 RepID=D2V6J1_NAEGR|nr:uncharacterized protein NAEGRDRAFT_64456 [Naegleria gruberi]EFC47583.1 predicted protein [Naegleria gruberi]|eukprot:XP_002680327.1 predicted protein [Naegleria gruberi strain NEG-M]
MIRESVDMDELSDGEYGEENNNEFNIEEDGEGEKRNKFTRLGMSGDEFETNSVEDEEETTNRESVLRSSSRMSERRQVRFDHAYDEDTRPLSSYRDRTNSSETSRPSSNLSSRSTLSGVDKETSQQITTALQSVIKKLGKVMIRDRLKRKIDANSPLDLESIKIAIKFFEEEEKDYGERSKDWLTLESVSQMYDLVLKTRILQPNGLVNIDRLKTILGNRVAIQPKILEVLIEKSRSMENESAIEYNKFIIYCITLTAHSLFTVLENALSLFCCSGSVTIHHQNEDDILAVDDFIYCIKFLADEERRSENNEVAQELVMMIDELKDLAKTEPVVTRGMVVLSISWQQLLESESAKVGGIENV